MNDVYMDKLIDKLLAELEPKINGDENNEWSKTNSETRKICRPGY